MDEPTNPPDRAITFGHHKLVNGEGLSWTTEGLWVDGVLVAHRVLDVHSLPAEQWVDEVMYGLATGRELPTAHGDDHRGGGAETGEGS